MKSYLLIVVLFSTTIFAAQPSSDDSRTRTLSASARLPRGRRPQLCRFPSAAQLPVASLSSSGGGAAAAASTASLPRRMSAPGPTLGGVSESDELMPGLLRALCQEQRRTNELLQQQNALLQQQVEASTQSTQVEAIRLALLLQGLSIDEQREVIEAGKRLIRAQPPSDDSSDSESE